MSSTNRGGTRNDNDLYETPGWCVDRLMEKITLPGGNWLEPGSGSGNIIRAVNTHRQDIRWTAVEKYVLRPERLQAAVGPQGVIEHHSFLEWQPFGRYRVAMGNPPYSRAMEFILRSRLAADHVVMLLRLNFLGSEARQDFLQRCPPDIYVLPNRPSFTGGKTDSTEYAWFHWPPQDRPAGLIQVLNTTPKKERCAR
jgi:hypothetical protein